MATVKQPQQVKNFQKVINRKIPRGRRNRTPKIPPQSQQQTQKIAA